MNFPRSSRRAFGPFGLLLALILAFTSVGLAPAQAALLPTAVGGTVTADGKPVEGATVTYYDGNQSVVATATTDAKGIYALSVESGNYRVKFEADGFQTQYWKGKYTFASSDQLTLLLAGRNDVGAELTLPPVLGGHVTGGGRPAAGIEVQATDAEGKAYTTTTDADGVYGVRVPIGSYTLHFGGTNRLAPEYFDNAATAAAATPVAVGPSGTSDADADLALNPFIAGTVQSSAGDAIEGALVEIATADGTTHDSDTTDPTGAFRVRLPAGQYVVKTSADGYATEYYDDAATADKATPVVLGAANVTLPQTITLASDSAIRGTVKDTSGKALKATVTAYRLAGDAWTEQVASVKTAADGSYALTLLPGDYRLGFEAAGHVTEYWNNATTIAAGATISLTRANDVTQTDAVLAPVRDSLAGTITGNGAALAGAEVTAELRTVVDGTTTWTAAGSAVADATGHYAFAELANGSYRLRFSGTGYLPEYYDNVTTAAKAKLVTVAAGTPVVADADLALASGGISGTVTGPDGALANIAVTVYDAAGKQLGSVATDAKGAYFLFLQPGDYRLRFDSANGRYATEYYDDAASLEQAKAVTVANTVVTGRNAVLAERKPLTGTITSGSATVPYAVVSLVTPGSATTADREVTSTYADANGAYTLYAAPGTYRLDVSSTSGAYESKSQTVNLTANGLVANVDLKAKHAIIGGVVGPEGKGVAGAEVTAFARVDGNWVSQGYAFTGGAGEYFLPIDAGTYRLEFSGHDIGLGTTYFDGASDLDSATDVVVTATDNAYASAALPATSGIKTTVKRIGPADVQADGLRVEFYRYDPVDDRYRAADTVDVLANQAGAGTELAELAAGTYKVRFRELTLTADGDELGPVQYYDGATSFAAAKTVTVGDQAIAPISLTYGHEIALVNTTAPTTSGTARVGETLTAKPGVWSPDGATFTYQWMRNGVDIADAKGTTYALTAADSGASVAVRVTAAKEQYVAASATSVGQKVAAGVIASTAVPKISGTLAVGKTLTASTGTWTPTGLTFTYQWLRDGQAIEGATKSTYTVTSRSLGHALSVKVTASKAGYTTASATSAKTATVKTTSSLTLSASSPSASRVVLKVTVNAPGTTATGAVTVKRGSATVGKGSLSGGKVTFTLKAEPRGKRTYTVSYAGNASVPAKTGKVSVTVR